MNPRIILLSYLGLFCRGLLAATISECGVQSFPDSVNNISSQVGDTTERRTTLPPVFNDIQNGLREGEILNFSGHFARQVYISLRGAESGYFSSNQTFYILREYLRTHRPISVAFTSTGDRDGMRYATGSAAVMYRGRRENLQIYVALSFLDGRWVITQFNVY